MQDEASVTRWSRASRWIVTILLALHLTAIISAPWSFPPPSSELSQRVSSLFEPYQTATLTRNGYRFFAPDPGPSGIIRYEIDKQDGDVITGRIPDAKQIWPRLLYHRNFMMTEVTLILERPVQTLPDPETLTPEERIEFEKQKEGFQRAEDLAILLRKGISRHLLQKHGGERVRLFVEVHLIPTPEDVKDGTSLNDPSLYDELGMISDYGKDEL